jgi:ribosomal-protein-serine acetyltransferase
VWLEGTPEFREGLMRIMIAHQLGDGFELAGLEPWHAEEFLEVVDRCRDHLRPEIPASHIIFSVDDARQYLQRWADAHAADARHLHGIWLDGKLVGCVQLFNFDTAMGTCEIGVWMAPEAQGREVVTRACRVVVDWAIHTRGMARVQWTNSPTNVRSSAVARRLGMTREGLLRSAWVVGGVRKDSEVWSMLADEWGGLPKHG